MSSSKRLCEIVTKWNNRSRVKERDNRSKGHVVLYAKGGKRYVVPLCYLNHPIFQVLLEMAAEEFGLVVHGPLQIPCEEELMNSIVLLIRSSKKEVTSTVTFTSCRVSSVNCSFFSSLRSLQ